jgi:hypothetical protein
VILLVSMTVMSSTVLRIQAITDVVYVVIQFVQLELFLFVS